MSTGTIKIVNDDSGDGYQYGITLATNFGDAYTLQNAIEHDFDIKDAFFDSEGSHFFAFAATPSIAADIAAALVSNVRLSSTYGTLIVEVL